MPVFINGLAINNWNSGAYTSELDKSPISIYQSGDSSYPAIGNVHIRGVSLTASQSAGVVAESLVFTQNTGTGGIVDVDVEIDNVFTNNTNRFIQSQAGNISVLNRGVFTQYTRWPRTSSFAYSLGIMADYDIYQPSAVITVTLPTAQAPLFVGHKSRFRFTPGGGANNFRLRSSVLPLYVNGVLGTVVTRCKSCDIILKWKD